MNRCTVCEDFATRLVGNAVLKEQALCLLLGDCRIRVRSNADELMERLRRYFGFVVTTDDGHDIDVIAVEREAPQLDVEFVDWRREPGKTGRKDSCHDFAGGRLVRKVRTGMVFLQSESRRIAAGPCLDNDNQVINFIITQYMNWLQVRDWLICHAAGVVRNGSAWGLAGFSGGGKSTLMLCLLEDDASRFLSNDRLFVSRQPGGVQAAGVPKLPRINPGTIVNNQRLHPLIPEVERAALLELPADQLWELEQKYDVMIDQLYGPGRIRMQAPLDGFLVLNWDRHSNAATRLERVDLHEQRALLGAIMKSPGPFMQYADGSFLGNQLTPDEDVYLAAFADVPVYAASGGVDFDDLARQLKRLMR